MNSGKTIFSQLMEFLPIHEFRKCIVRYNGNYKVKSFTCWDQFLCMAFAQLTYRESLRDIQACLRGTRHKLYHMGIRGNISRNTLANANKIRDWRIYSDLAQVLIRKARRVYSNESLGVELDQTVYALDSTTIKVAVNNLSHIRPEKAILPFKVLTIYLFKCFEIYPVKLNDPIPDDICVFYKRSKTRSIYEIYYLTG